MTAVLINISAEMAGDKMSPEAIGTAASSMRSVGTDVSTNGGEVLAAWQPISKSYDAPEAATLFHAMDPVKTAAEGFGTDVGKACDALVVFAEEVRVIRKAVEAIRTEAAAFIASVEGGVEKESPGAKGDTFTRMVPWHEDAASIATNNALMIRANDQLEALMRAERTCANAIYAIIGHAPIEAASAANCGQGYGVDQIPDDAAMPWGQPGTKTENCSEKIAHGMANGAGAMAGGFASLAGFEYTGKGLWDQWDWSWDHSWANMGNAWKGVGMFGVGVATFGPAGLALSTIPGPVGTFFGDSQKMVPAAVAGLVAIDLYAKDPLHKWKESGWKALGETGFNALSFVVAPAKAGSLGKLGRVGSAASRLGDPLYLATQASRAARTVLGPSIETLFRLNRAIDLDGMPGVRQVELDLPSVRHTDVSTDTPNLGTRTDTDAPPPRDYAGDREGAGDRSGAGDRQDEVPAGARDRTDERTGDSGREAPAQAPGDGPNTGRDAGADGPVAGGREDAPQVDPGAGDGTPNAGDGSRPADTTPTNDPNLGKSSPDVRAQVDQIRSDIGPDLQHQADEAWQRAVDRADAERLADPSLPAASPQKLGSYAHAELDRWIETNADTLVDPDQGYRVRSEASFNDQGVAIDTPEKGSIRPDVVIERRNAGGGWEVVHVVDLKTGRAGISGAWERAVQGRLQPLYPSETLRPNKVPVAVP